MGDNEFKINLFKNPISIEKESSPRIVLRYDKGIPFPIDSRRDIDIGDLVVENPSWEEPKREIYIIDDISNRILWSNYGLRNIEKNLLDYPRIFIDNDSIAFFNVDEPSNGEKLIDELPGSPILELYGELYNSIVLSTKVEYFRFNDVEFLETISVTSMCTVFCAYTMENGSVKSSGVFHRWFKDGRLEMLIDGVKSHPEEEVFVKGTGSYGRGRKWIRNICESHRAQFNPENFVLGKCSYRRTKFNPLTGELTTYFADGKPLKII